MGTFAGVRAAELLASGAALAVIAALVWLVRGRGPRVGIPAALRRAEEIAGSLGDAVLVADAAGRIVRANDAAVVLTGTERLVGTKLEGLGPDLPAAARGLERGPVRAFVELAAAAGPIRARAALSRIASRPAFDLVVIRVDAPLARPPPLPIPRVAPGVDEAASARAALAAADVALKEPLARAGRAASLLRLVSPRLAPRAEAALAAIDAALDDGERRLAALAAAGEGGPRRALDLAALVREIVGAFAPAGDVRVRTRIAPAYALGNDRALRAAVREILRAVARAGGDVEVQVAATASGPAVEISGGAPLDGAAALARALVAPLGGRVEEHEAPGRGHVVRVALVAAPADALAPA